MFFPAVQILNELDTSNFDAVDEEAIGDEQMSSQSSGGGGTNGTFGLTSAPHAFPDFTFKRFFDQDQNNSDPNAVGGLGLEGTPLLLAAGANLCASEVWPQNPSALYNQPAQSTSTSFQ